MRTLSKSITAILPALFMALNVLAAQPATTPENDPAAVKKQYDMIFSRLDPGGDLMLIANVEGYIERTMNDIVNALTLMPTQPGEKEDISKVVREVHAFLKKNGFYAIRGVGMSVVPRVSGDNRIKMFLSRDPKAAGLPLWRGLVGYKRRKLAGTDFLPSDTVLARVGSGELSEIWKLIRQAVKELVPPKGAAEFDKEIAKISAGLGMDIDKLIQSAGDEGFISLQFSRLANIQVPAAGGSLIEIPTPSLLIGLKMKDDSLVKLIEKHLAVLAQSGQMPIGSTQVGTTTIKSIVVPLPLPLPLQPAYASHNGYFLLGSNPETVSKAVTAFEKKDGLTATADYKKAFAGLPVENNGIVYAHPRFAEVLAKIQKAALDSAGKKPGAAGNKAEEAAFMEAIMKIGDMGKPQSSAMVLLNLKDGVLTAGTSTGGGKEIVAATMIAPMGIMAGMLLPAISSAREKARRTACMSNLAQMGKASILYSMDHDEKYPPDLKSLGTIMSFANTYVCKSSGHKPGDMATVDQWTDYILVGNLRASDSARAVLAFCKPESHKGKGTNVLYVDGSVQWLSSTAFERLLMTPSEFFGTVDSKKLSELQQRAKLPVPYDAMLLRPAR